MNLFDISILEYIPDGIGNIVLILGVGWIGFSRFYMTTAAASKKTIESLQTQNEVLTKEIKQLRETCERQTQQIAELRDIIRELTDQKATPSQ